MSRIKALYDAVVVEKHKREEVTEGGIVLPDMKGEGDQKIGTVVAVGEGRILPDGDLRPLAVKPGDTVVIESFSGTKLELSKKEKYTIVKEDEILAVLEEE